jgi:hypothetical protein
MCMAGMGMLGAVMQLGGSMMGAAGAAAEGRKAQEIAEKNAKLLREKGQYEARQIRRQVTAVNGRAVAQAGVRGLAIAGSMLDVMLDSSVQGEIDAVNTIKTAEAQADVQIAEGEAARMRANNSAVSQIIGGFSGFMKAAA